MCKSIFQSKKEIRTFVQTLLSNQKSETNLSKNSIDYNQNGIYIKVCVIESNRVTMAELAARSPHDWEIVGSKLRWFHKSDLTQKDA